MDASEIDSAESLRVWLSALPRNTAREQEQVRCLATALSHRYAMRGVHFLLHRRTDNPSRASDLETLDWFRCLLISGVAAIHTSPAIRAAAAAARAEGHFFASSAATAARVAAAESLVSLPRGAGIHVVTPAEPLTDSVVSATAHAFTTAFTDAKLTERLAPVTGESTDPDDVAERVTAFAATAAASLDDCVAWQNGASLMTRPLWPDTNPVEKRWQALRDALLHSRAAWRFWIDWYDKALRGEPQDWTGHLTEIALIQPVYWQQGPEHIAMLISGLTPR